MKLRLYESTVDDKARMTTITYIIGLTFLSTALVLVYKFYDYQKRFKDLEKKLEKTLQNRKDERIGRTRAEKRYRELLLERNPAGVEQLKPVAVARTVFHDRRGAPRQGGVTPQARGILEMLPWTQPHLTLTGLQDFSHLWVIFGMYICRCIYQYLYLVPML